MKSTHLENRSLVRIDGAEAVEFLQNLVTCDVEILSEGEATFGALLTPQGKILFDFFCVRTADGFLFDIDASLRPGFIKRIMFYRLRAPVEIAAVDDRRIYAIWDGEPDDPDTITDPRHAAMGFRMIAREFDTNADADNYRAHRIAFGMPEGGLDYAYGDAFPHDAMMDQFESKGAGVAFEKGCYVGQEVVSRMKHRGTARRRIVMVSADTDLPPPGTSIDAGGKSIGTLGSTSGNNGLAMARIDRLAKAEEIMTAGVKITAKLPDWTDIQLESA